jgi:hypothetical protein
VRGDGVDFGFGAFEQRVSPAYCRILVHFRWIEVLWQANR